MPQSPNSLLWPMSHCLSDITSSDCFYNLCWNSFNSLHIQASFASRAVHELLPFPGAVLPPEFKDMRLYVLQPLLGDYFCLNSLILLLSESFHL